MPRDLATPPRPGGAATLALRARTTLKGDKGARTVDVVASTEAVNSYGYIVEQNWDLDRYLANPVILYAHNEAAGFGTVEAEDTIPIGRGENVRVEDGELRLTIRFATAAVSDLAERCYQGFVEGMLNAVSVGFDPLDVVIEKRDGEDIAVVKRAELWEISVVPVPGDPGAVAAAQRMTLAAKVAAHADPPRIAQKKDTNMDSPLLKALGISDPVSEVDALALVTHLRSQQSDLLKLTGESSADKALGIVGGWRLAAEKLPAIEAELAALRAQESGRAIDALVADGKAAGKLTPALEVEVREVAKLSIDRARSFVAAMPTIAALVAPPVAEPQSENSTVALKHEGKAYEQLAYQAKADLEVKHPEIFAAMRADWQRRGEPRND